ncbi:beta-ketoacyl synthase N-terminal-like domain-containing protein [Streptomyces fildesensis]|uniref:Beta-ketoacyl synthase N-terminal-like domain-containing protein n=1 Tax=Streptomyces fildesensis TaxID=375757 RepID=A0ABW8C378_9ACTN
MTAVVTGVGVVLPRAASAAELMEPRPPGADPVEPKDLVGKKGLRYKDRATQLAYCAADAALRDALLLGDTGLSVPGQSVAVVASSNYGNVDTVCQAVDTIAAQTAAAASPMSLPNASSNVIASSIAIRFGLRGPNLMLCNGATSGLDAVRWAQVLLQGGRASRVLVVGVEPDNETVRELTGGAATVDGAAALVLEDATAAAERGAAALAVVGRYARGAGLTACLEHLAVASSGGPALWQVPESRTGRSAGRVAGPGGDSAGLLAGVTRHDLGELFGIGSGALGVLQCAAAVGWFALGGAGPVYATAGTDADDATSGLVLSERATA